MRRAWGWVAAASIVALAGCAAIAGFEDEYTVGDTGTGTAGSGTGTASSGTGAGTASTGSGTASTSAGGQGSGGAGASGAERCLDGVDNDDDGLADCADPDCADYTCVAEVAGATQYLTAVAASADCPADAPAVDLQSCASCTCNADGGTCQSSVTFYYDSSCTSVVTTHNTPWNCVTPNANRWAKGFTTPDNDASCTPASAQISSDARPVCEITSGGACPAGGEVCVPTPSSTERHCVVVGSGSSCPAPYTQREAAFVGATTTCNCSCSAGSQTCPGPIVIASSSTSNCTSTQTYHPNDSSCTSVGYAASLQTLAVDGQVTCSASGAAATTPTNEGVVCCLP
ncbi:MAG: hypothetical protein JRI23_32065 [Deltaproteobacteria bacterium]|nr:hypothetical protein [Deltaproteobacteria bacterium]MBW2536867.1 hypothetical protein [Deltaproteobacteria bacterium]